MKCKHCGFEESEKIELICCKDCYWNIFHSNIEKMLKLHNLKEDTEIKEVKRLVEQVLEHLEGKEEN